MRFPRFWKSAEGEVTRGVHRGLKLMAWGWSDHDEDEAHRLAEQRARALVQVIEQTDELPSRAGRRYDYADRPLREEVLGAVRLGSHLEPFPVGADPTDVAGLVTRNGYGVEVLNTQRLLVLDVDLPVGGNGGGFFAWFRKRKVAPETRLLDTVRVALEGAGGGWRIYRTFAGFRLLCIDRPLAPDDVRAQHLLALPFVDEAYRTLCRVQESWRARLTPKPFRCGLRPPAVRFPYLGVDDGRRMRAWVDHYDRVTTRHATCSFVEGVGEMPVHRELTGLVALHDERSGALTGRPLA